MEIMVQSDGAGIGLSCTKSRKIRVFQVASGNVGTEMIKRIQRHPDLELIGLHCYSPEKVGRDAGELVGDVVGAAERIGGFAALHRSWALVRRALPAQLMLIVAAAVATVALTQGLGRLLPDRAVLAHALLDAAVAVLVVPLPAFASVVLYLRERALLEGRTIEELRQYIFGRGL